MMYIVIILYDKSVIWAGVYFSVNISICSELQV